MKSAYNIVYSTEETSFIPKGSGEIRSFSERETEVGKDAVLSDVKMRYTRRNGERALQRPLQSRTTDDTKNVNRPRRLVAVFIKA